MLVALERSFENLKAVSGEFVAKEAILKVINRFRPEPDNFGENWRGFVSSLSPERIRRFPLGRSLDEIWQFAEFGRVEVHGGKSRQTRTLHKELNGLNEFLKLFPVEDFPGTRIMVAKANTRRTVRRGAGGVSPTDLAQLAGVQVEHVRNLLANGRLERGKDEGEKKLVASHSAKRWLASLKGFPQTLA